MNDVRAKEYLKEHNITITDTDFINTVLNSITVTKGIDGTACPLMDYYNVMSVNTKQEVDKMLINCEDRDNLFIILTGNKQAHPINCKKFKIYRINKEYFEYMFTYTFRGSPTKSNTKLFKALIRMVFMYSIPGIENA